MKTLFILGLTLIAFATKAQEDSPLDSVNVKILSTDLSEDMSVVSSKNDELLILVFKFSDSLGQLSKPSFIQEFVFDERQMEMEGFWLTNRSDSMAYLFFLLELDSKKTEVQISPVLRVHYKRVIECYNQRDYNCIQKFLGDEDVLGYGYFTVPSKHELNGVYKLDRYTYRVEFE